MSGLLVTGGSGYLGSHLIRVAPPPVGVCATYFSRPFTPARGAAVPLDLRDADRVWAVIRETRPSAIIHTACSNRDPDNVAAIVPAARNLARAAREFDIRLVHVSTDLIFDGEHAPYSDDAPPAPLMAYGQAKAEAEAALADLYPAALSVRPSLIWGLDPLDRQTTWLVEGLQRGEHVTLFTDEFRSPVWVRDLCAALLELAARADISGTLNLGGPQPLNRWDFGMKLLAGLGLEPASNVVRGTVRDSGLVRPRNLTLISARARALIRAPLRSVDDAIRAFN